MASLAPAFRIGCDIDPADAWIFRFSEAIAPEGRLELEPGVVLNTAGFGRVVDHAVSISIEGGPTLPFAPLPLYALLKLVAFSDRHAGKDLGSVLHCLEHYREADDRRYEVDHDGAGVPFDNTCAVLARWRRPTVS